MVVLSELYPMTILIRALLCPPHGHQSTEGIFPAKNWHNTMSKAKKDNTGRFIVNTTVGVVGIFNVAEKIGFPEYEKEDYGQTLGVMGVGPGCYLVLPVLGPSTIRDTAGSFANILGGDAWYNVTVANNTEHFTDFDYYASRASSGIDFRAKNIDSFENLEKNSMDFYASVKSLYLQDRQLKIANSNAITETQNDSDWEEIQTQ